MLNFLCKLFCFGHEWEVEQSLLDGEYYEVCRRCEKVKKNG